MSSYALADRRYRLAVIPGDPLDAYKRKGTSIWLEDYYNPCHFFDEVYLFSPYEDVKRTEFGMTIIPTESRELPKRIVDFGIDVVRAYGGHWPCDMACRHKVKGIPVVVSVHDTNPRMLYRSIRRADVVFCMSQAVRDLVLNKRGRPESTWVLPNRVNFDTMKRVSLHQSAELNSQYPSRIKILHVGRRTKQKNLDTVIRALPLLGKDYTVLSIGRGEATPYLRLAKRLGVPERIHFIDAVPNEELARYYSWADCLCTPSRFEGFGLVFIEALACEAVVVTSDIRPMNEYIRHMHNGILVKDFENPVALAESIRNACTDSRLRANLMKTARGSVEKFEKSVVDRMERSYYRRVLAAYDGRTGR